MAWSCSSVISVWAGKAAAVLKEKTPHSLSGVWRVETFSMIPKGFYYLKRLWIVASLRVKTDRSKAACLVLAMTWRQTLRETPSPAWLDRVDWGQTQTGRPSTRRVCFMQQEGWRGLSPPDWAATTRASDSSLLTTAKQPETLFIVRMRITNLSINNKLMT